MGHTKELAAQLQTEDYIERGHIDFLNANKKQIAEMVAVAREAVVNGDYDENKALVYAAKLEHAGKELNKAIRPIVENKLKSAISLYDCDLKCKETGVSYDFSVCGDTEWQYLSERKAFFEQELKAREALLKTITKNTVMIIEGEEVEIKPPVRFAKQGVELKIK